jgi:hypothetical protein
MRPLGPRWAAAAVALALAFVPGCKDDPPRERAASPSTTPAVPGPGAARARPARPEDTRIIRSWADTLRAGRVGAAAEHFTVPALVENGPPPLELRTRAAVEEFNRALPCGARLIDTRQIGRYTVATFRLTERPDGDCGTGTGHRAATAFRFRGGRIEEWRRVPVPDEPAPRPEPPPSDDEV